MILLDGISLLYQNAVMPQGNFTLQFSDLVQYGAVDSNYPIQQTPQQNIPIEGPIIFANGQFDFSPRSGQILSQADVMQILTNAVAQANKTRAAIRQPLGSSARVFIAVCDLDGTILGMWRTADATMFSYDVSGQKARTAIAFSDSSDAMGMQFRNYLGLQSNITLAVSTRALGFMAQRYYPPGQDLNQPGPYYIYVDGQFDFQFMRLPTRTHFKTASIFLAACRFTRTACLPVLSVSAVMA
jgi:uncharacterized protein GlcG (DUF336 family)